MLGNDVLKKIKGRKKGKKNQKIQKMFFIVILMQQPAL